MISLEQENSLLRGNKTGIKQSSFSNYSAGELPDPAEKNNDSDRKIQEIQNSSSSLSKKSFSNEGCSPQNSHRPGTDSGSETFSNFRALETIPENTDEHFSLNQTKEGISRKLANIHLSMPASRENEVLNQPKFMFNSLQKGPKKHSTPAFPQRNKSSPDVDFQNQKDFMFKTSETGANFNPFRKNNRDLDIEIESENSHFTSTRDPSSRSRGGQRADEVIFNRSYYAKFFWRIRSICSSLSKDTRELRRNSRFCRIISSFPGIRSCSRKGNNCISQFSSAEKTPICPN